MIERFAVPEVVLLQLSWRKYKRGSHRRWENCEEVLNGNWLALMEAVLKPGAWRALETLLKIRDSHRRLHLEPGGFLVTKKGKLRQHWLWSGRQRVHWKKRLREIDIEPLVEETTEQRTEYISALGTTELDITHLGSGVDAAAIILAGERFEGALVTILAILSGGIYSPRASARLSSPKKDRLRFRPGPPVEKRNFQSTLDGFQPKAPSKMLGKH